MIVTKLWILLVAVACVASAVDQSGNQAVLSAEQPPLTAADAARSACTKYNGLPLEVCTFVNKMRKAFTYGDIDQVDDYNSLLSSPKPAVPMQFIGAPLVTPLPIYASLGKDGAASQFTVMVPSSVPFYVQAQTFFQPFGRLARLLPPNLMSTPDVFVNVSQVLGDRDAVKEVRMVVTGREYVFPGVTPTVINDFTMYIQMASPTDEPNAALNVRVTGTWRAGPVVHAISGVLADGQYRFGVTLPAVSLPEILDAISYGGDRMSQALDRVSSSSPSADQMRQILDVLKASTAPATDVSIVITKAYLALSGNAAIFGDHTETPFNLCATYGPGGIVMGATFSTSGSKSTIADLVFSMTNVRATNLHIFTPVHVAISIATGTISGVPGFPATVPEGIHFSGEGAYVDPHVCAQTQFCSAFLVGSANSFSFLASINPNAKSVITASTKDFTFGECKVGKCVKFDALALRFVVEGQRSRLSVRGAIPRAAGAPYIFRGKFVRRSSPRGLNRLEGALFPENLVPNVSLDVNVTFGRVRRGPQRVLTNVFGMEVSSPALTYDLVNQLLGGSLALPVLPSGIVDSIDSFPVTGLHVSGESPFTVLAASCTMHLFDRRITMADGFALTFAAINATVDVTPAFYSQSAVVPAAKMEGRWTVGDVSAAVQIFPQARSIAVLANFSDVSLDALVDVLGQAASADVAENMREMIARGRFNQLRMTDAAFVLDMGAVNKASSAVVSGAVRYMQGAYSARVVMGTVRIDRDWQQVFQAITGPFGNSDLLSYITGNAAENYESLDAYTAAKHGIVMSSVALNVRDYPRLFLKGLPLKVNRGFILTARSRLNDVCKSRVCRMVRNISSKSPRLRLYVSVDSRKTVESTIVLKNFVFGPFASARSLLTTKVSGNTTVVSVAGDLQATVYNQRLNFTGSFRLARRRAQVVLSYASRDRLSNINAWNLATMINPQLSGRLALDGTPVWTKLRGPLSLGSACFSFRESDKKFDADTRAQCLPSKEGVVSYDFRTSGGSTNYVAASTAGANMAKLFSIVTERTHTQLGAPNWLGDITTEEKIRFSHSSKDRTVRDGTEMPRGQVLRGVFSVLGFEGVPVTGRIHRADGATKSFSARAQLPPIRLSNGALVLTARKDWNGASMVGWPSVNATGPRLWLTYSAAKGFTAEIKARVCVFQICRDSVLNIANETVTANLVGRIFNGRYRTHLSLRAPFQHLPGLDFSAEGLIKSDQLRDEIRGIKEQAMEQAMEARAQLKAAHMALRKAQRDLPRAQNNLCEGNKCIKLSCSSDCQQCRRMATAQIGQVLAEMVEKRVRAEHLSDQHVATLVASGRDTILTQLEEGRREASRVEIGMDAASLLQVESASASSSLAQQATQQAASPVALSAAGLESVDAKRAREFRALLDAEAPLIVPSVQGLAAAGPALAKFSSKLRQGYENLCNDRCTHGCRPVPEAKCQAKCNKFQAAFDQAKAALGPAKDKLRKLGEVTLAMAAASKNMAEFGREFLVIHRAHFTPAIDVNADANAIVARLTINLLGKRTKEQVPFNFFDYKPTLTALMSKVRDQYLFRWRSRVRRGDLKMSLSDRAKAVLRETARLPGMPAFRSFLNAGTSPQQDEQMQLMDASPLPPKIAQEAALAAEEARMSAKEHETPANVAAIMDAMSE